MYGIIFEAFVIMLVTIEQKGALVVSSLGYGLVYVFNIEALLSTLIRAPTLTHIHKIQAYTTIFA